MAVNEMLEKMNPEQLGAYWKNRRGMAWVSLGGILGMVAIGGFGIVIPHGEVLAWILEANVLIYFLGNGVLEVIEKIRK